jgi:hypothetical protein
LSFATSFVSFSGLNFGSPQCYASRRLDYIDNMVMQTLTPIVVILLLVLCFGIHVTKLVRGGATHADIQTIVGRYATFFFLITYLVLPTVTVTIAGSVYCIDVDPDRQVSSKPLYYLNKDLSISCDSNRYQFGIIWAAVMVIVYPVGIPALYLYVLYRNRHAIMYGTPEKELRRKSLEVHHNLTAEEEADVLAELETRQKEEEDRLQTESNHRVPKQLTDYITPKEIYFLHQAYEPQFWYWEIVETGRRLLLTAVISIVATGTMDNNTYPLHTRTQRY